MTTKGELVGFLDQCGGNEMPLQIAVRCKVSDKVTVCDIETIEVITVDGLETIHIECA